MLSIKDLKSDGTNEPGDKQNSSESVAETGGAPFNSSQRPTRNRRKTGELRSAKTTGNLGRRDPVSPTKNSSSQQTNQKPAAEEEEIDPFTLIKANFDLEGRMAKARVVEETKPASKPVIPPASEKNPASIVKAAKPAPKELEKRPETGEKPATLSNPVTSKKLSRARQSSYDQRRLDFQFHRIIQQLDIKPSLEIPLVIGVTSTLRGEGRTTVALGLAAALAQEIPLPVVLLETDLERPSLADDLTLANRGLCEYLGGELELDDLAQSTDLPGLRVIVAGDCEVAPLKVLRSERLDKLVKILSQQSAVVVVDLPPMATTGEAARVISQLDRVLMVVEAGKTPAKLVQSALELIPDEKLAGVLLNRTKPAFGFFHRIKGLFR